MKHTSNHQSRRNFLAAIGATALATRHVLSQEMSLPELLYTTEDPTHGKRRLFDGKTLRGWRAIPRLDVRPAIDGGNTPASELADRILDYHQNNPESESILGHTGSWEVKEGAIVGGQNPAGCGLGAYLITEETFADFELEFEVNHDWPVDSGLLIRQHPVGALGYQIAVEPRPRGNMGGFYVNGIGNFRSAPFYIDALELPNFKYTQITQGIHDSRPFWPLDYAAHFEDFVKIWRPNDWNRYRVRCVGKVPTLTTWINGLKIASLNYENVRLPQYNREMALKYLGQPGHIGLEVHNSPPTGMGRNRWAPGAVCRWRNITIQPL